MEVRLLGPIELLSADRRVPIGPPQQRLVLAALAVDVDAVVHVDIGEDKVDVPYEQIKTARTVFEWK